MTQKSSVISSVPTNIITGFLGVGKTSAILQLLKTKPDNERWAVLVNEFGEIGVDGSLFAGQHGENSGVFIREVPGGCMCCAAGLPMQIALNQLLARAKPDRLLIEPTGLGHPFEVFEVLSSESYRDILALQKTITLVDARKLKDSRYTGNKTFNQQIAIADVIVGNKKDLYLDREESLLKEYVDEVVCSKAEIIFASFGEINPDLLSGQSMLISRRESENTNKKAHVHSCKEDDEPLNTANLEEPGLPEAGYLKAVNEGEGYKSVGWRFSAKIVFERKKLFSLLSALNVERMKAVFITDEGIFGYNLTSDALTEFAIDEALESRIEIIDQSISGSLEVQINNCIKNAESSTSIDRTKSMDRTNNIDSAKNESAKN